jgi:methyl-accepting chemotaxis protein
MNATLPQTPVETSQISASGRPEVSAQQLRDLADVCDRAARGDLEARSLDASANGDFGRLCTAINRMLDMADAYARESAAAMAECSQDRFHRPILLRGLQGGYRQASQTINRAGLKMCDSSKQLASTGRLAVETAQNISSIAAACEELSASNGEISHQTTESARLTAAAVRQAQETVSSMQSLNNAMQKIDSFLGMINKIAGQTNLLALNATIEAARAGDQGRGFAVVANEVKELSKSSAQASDDIASQIEAMRSVAQDAMTCMQSVNASVQKINDGAASISQSIEQQVQATGEISRNIAAASASTREISEGMKTRAAAR